ncbi:MAG: hypothetical protein HFG32_00175 [Eubacterium sp.]|nr:hypothetical protein [Eubacterium sp.]
MKKTIQSVMVCCMFFFVFSILSGTDTVEAKKMTSVEQAKKAALKKVPSATVIKVGADYEDGVRVYEVELLKAGKEHNFEYRASDGKLLQYDWEINNPPIQDQNKKNISKKAIQKKARNKVKKATVLGTALTYDDGRAEYKVKLSNKSKSYKLVYDAKSGKLLEYEWKLLASGGSSGADGKDIGLEKAKSIAQKKAPGATIVKAKRDTDDGIKVYEIELVQGMYEYDVKIDAKTGKILEFEKDIDD